MEFILSASALAKELEVTATGFGRLLTDGRTISS